MFDSKVTAEKIRERLIQEFSPIRLEIEDQSHLHKGHRQAGGGGHFFVEIHSAKFQGVSPLARQRMVISAVGEMMDREVHALSMKCVPVMP